MVLLGVIILLSSIENFSLQDTIWISRSSGQKVYKATKFALFQSTLSPFTLLVCVFFVLKSN
jgi:hypothetical protein